MSDALKDDFEARYQAWLAEREREGCVCLTCIALRRNRMATLNFKSKDTRL